MTTITYTDACQKYASALYDLAKEYSDYVWEAIKEVVGGMSDDDIRDVIVEWQDIRRTILQELISL